MAYSIMPMYNTDSAVGPYKANKADDVRLIQTLLLGCAQTHPRPPDFPPPVALSVNGSWSPALGQWILGFQKAAAKKGLVGVVDGVVDPLPTTDARDWSSKAGARYFSLFLLNGIYRAGHREQHHGLGRQLGLDERAYQNLPSL